MNIDMPKHDALEEMDKFPAISNLSALNHKETEKSEISTRIWTESAIKSLPAKRGQTLNVFICDFYLLFKEELIRILPKHFH